MCCERARVMVAVSARPYGDGDVTCGDLFGRRLVAAPLPTHTPAECGRATLPSVGRRYIFSLAAGLPTYVRTRAKMSSRDVAAPLLVRRVVLAFTFVYITWVSVRSARVCERPRVRARFRERSTSRTGLVFMD